MENTLLAVMAEQPTKDEAWTHLECLFGLKAFATSHANKIAIGCVSFHVVLQISFLLTRERTE